ncbi:hypothetical protein COY95_00190, partial [Candidatus Woesearchaeota archaeon CG_4_10_14_0_8_um_filter_47_5]
MVFEQFFRERWIEKRPIHAFFLGSFYTLIGILSAFFVFNASLGIMSVAFTSILLVLSLNELLRREENLEIREKKFSLRLLFKDHKDIFEIYTFLFLGIFLTYGIVSALFPGQVILDIFKTQLEAASLAGNAFNTGALFLEILVNNLIVLVACFLLSFFYGAGSIIFITWQASVWGVVFGYIARRSATFGGALPVGTSATLNLFEALFVFIALSIFISITIEWALHLSKRLARLEATHTVTLE